MIRPLPSMERLTCEHAGGEGRRRAVPVRYRAIVRRRSRYRVAPGCLLSAGARVTARRSLLGRILRRLSGLL